MDPISHGVIGLALYSLGNTPTLSSAACIGAVLGSISPDFDIVARFKGDYVYLNHHRVETHSIPGLAILSGLITIILSLGYSTFSFYEVFLWTFLGGLSHSFFDYLNSYGVALLYPYNKKKYSLNLLMIYDPVIILLSLYSIVFRPRTVMQYSIMVGISTIYLLYRWFDRSRLSKNLRGCFKEKDCIRNLNIMPSDFNLLKWDYIVETDNRYIVGEINSITLRNQVIKKLTKRAAPIIEKSLKDQLGVYFSNFTPIFHIDLIKEKEKFIVRMTDLRYRFRNEFKHHACFYYNQEENLIKSVFHPFSLNNAIEIYNQKSVDSR
ncbi:inner membrane protein [Natronincola peptidivorans]|uniref:Inner membrane protein n=1 Tax=Natronincola peptidivorans TaxID=426128 RepID=A0A1I0GX89_9FIRM|nr:metal-dependent hydrolase [Natronincola peptidivorans]SET75863.1 inner membrane protein [Natronincola peptidivorans]